MPTRCGQCLSAEVEYSDDGSARCHACGAVTQPGGGRPSAVPTETVTPEPTTSIQTTVFRPSLPVSRGPVWRPAPAREYPARYAAGVLAIIGGALLIAATPVTLLIVSLLAPVILDLLFSFGCFGVCVHTIFGVFAVRFGMEALKGRAKEGGVLIAAGIVAIAGAIFLLGGLLGFLGGILLLVAGAMTYSS